MNICKYYYKDYYLNNIDQQIEGDLGINYHDIEDDQNAETIAKRNNHLTKDYDTIYTVYNCAEDIQCIKLKVAYPGLVTGVGICHETGIKGELKLGMHFDYTTGMPIVYGSSVKGVLNDYFLEFFDEWAKIETNGVRNFNSEIDKKHLFFDIFGDKVKDDANDYPKKSIYKRDIFFDAVIVHPNRSKKILETDSITPHGENPLLNPIPITFLKIASGVTMEFRFRLNGSQIGNHEFNADKKLSLFKYILEQVGVGAKTNVGYGQLTPVE